MGEFIRKGLFMDASCLCAFMLSCFVYRAAHISYTLQIWVALRTGCTIHQSIITSGSEKFSLPKWIMTARCTFSEMMLVFFASGERLCVLLTSQYCLNFIKVTTLFQKISLMYSFSEPMALS